MNKLTLICISLLSFSAFSSPDKIASHEAYNHLNSLVTVCGQLSGVRKLRENIKLDVDGKYPNSNISFSFNSNIAKKLQKKWGGFNNTEGQTICASGVVEEVRGELQITLHHQRDIEIIK